MTHHDRHRRLRAIAVAILTALVLTGLLAASQAFAGDIKRLRKESRISVLRPIRATGRSAAHYPVASSVANVTRTAANVSGLFSPGAIIANILFR